MNIHVRLKAMVQLDIRQGFRTIVRLISFVQKEREWRKKLIVHPGGVAVRAIERVSEQKTWIFKIHVNLIVKVNVLRLLICQNKSPIWTDKWLKIF